MNGISRRRNTKPSGELHPRPQWVEELALEGCLEDVEHSYRFRQETGYEGADWAFDCVGSSDEGISVGDRVEFSKPVDVGDRVTAVCEVVDDLGQDKYQLTTDVVNGEGRLIEGQAVVLVDDPPEIGTLSVEPISGTGSMQGSSR